MNHYVRPAKTSDSSAIAKILSDWIDETPWMPRIHTREEDQQFGGLLIEKTKVKVVEHQKRIDGFIALQEQTIQALYVHEEFRVIGVGSALLNSLKNENSKLDLWTFQQNTQAREFYAKHGFSEKECTDGAGNDEKLPDVRLCWRAIG